MIMLGEILSWSFVEVKGSIAMVTLVYSNGVNKMDCKMDFLKADIQNSTWHSPTTRIDF